jgi:hypothetical protein
VTSRLRSIASQAFSGGGINTAELSQELARIDTIIGEYGESVSVPAVSGRQGKSPGAPDIIESLRKLRESGDGMSHGNSYNFEAINSQVENFSRMEKSAGNEVKVIKESMNEILAGYPAFNSDQMTVMSRRTADAINQSPVSAMASHDVTNTVRTRINVYG